MTVRLSQKAGLSFAALVLVSCAAPAILGHDDPQSIETVCPGGVVCDIGYDCPTVPGGVCEADSRVTPQWMRKPGADAGK